MPNRLRPSQVRRLTAPDRSVRRLLTRIDELEAAQEQARRAQAALLETTQALKESEERYALAMRGPNEGLWDWNPISKELYLSARLLSILGFESDTLRTTSYEWLKLVHPDDVPGYEARVVEHLKGLTAHFEHEYRVRDRQGNYRWVLARGLALRDEQGCGTRMVGSIGDVTERKEREATLKASESRFRSLFEVAAGAILVIDGQGLIRDFNREAERLFGLDRAAVLDCHWSSLPGAGQSGFGALLHRARSGSLVRDREASIPLGPGGWHHVSWSLALLRDGSGSVVAVGTDVTVRRLAENALHEANETLERRVAERTREAESARIQAELANRAKSEFLAHMSHELRTPLNAIIGFSDTMRLGVMGPVEHPRYAEYVHAIHDSGTHLLTIINEILDLAKIEAGRFDLMVEEVDLTALMVLVIRLMEDRARDGDVVLSMHCAPDLGRGRLDALRIKQVLLNLLSNAVKFTDAGGRVSLSARHERGYLVITVEDSGIGMDADGLARALEPFGQINSQLSRRHAGTGLGLPLTKRFVEMHGGSMDIWSSPGRGTKVTLTLPLDR